MPRMDAGRLRHRVQFERPVTELDSDGAQVETWLDAFPELDGAGVFAEITPLSGRELIAAQAVQSKVTTRLRVRYRPGYAAAWRATHRGTVYNIEGVIPDADSGFQFVTLLCSSGVNQG